MVRREGIAAGPAGRSVEEGMPCCTVLAGASPAWVITGEPSSRLQLRGEITVAERSVKSPERGSNEAGRNQVNAEKASSNYQPKGVWERGGNSPRVARNCATGRARHVGAKATDSATREPEGALDLPGVLAAARFEGMVWNTRGPTWQPTSGKDRTHKARAESGRSREGVRGARGTDEGGDNPLEGRGPALVTLELKVSARACP
jgi:hypothetical protein